MAAGSGSGDDHGSGEDHGSGDDDGLGTPARRLQTPARPLGAPAQLRGAAMDHEVRPDAHPVFRAAAAETAALRPDQRVDRRRLLRIAGLLGVGTTTAGVWADGLLGVPLDQAAAESSDPREGAGLRPVAGGALRCAMRVMAAPDPARFDWVEMSNAVRHQHEHLTITGPDNVTRPMLAERWAASDDLRTWTLFLRAGVLWRSGDPFDADDVAFNFARWLDPATDSATRALFSALPASGVEIVDALTVRLHLSRPLLSLPENLYSYPTAIVRRDFDGDATRERNGTGAYEIVEHAPGEISISRRVRADGFSYWGADVAHIGPPLLDEIQYVEPELVYNGASPAEALAADRADMTYEVDVEAAAEARRAPGVEVRFADTAQTGCIRMRVDAPPFDDVRVRQAVQACCEPSAYPGPVFDGRGRPGEHHHVSPIHPAYFPLPEPRADVERARGLLAAAGRPDGVDLTLVVGDTGGPWQTRACELLAAQAAPAGVRIRVERVAPETYFNVWRTTAFGLTQWAHRPLGTMALSLGYRSGAAWNETGYANAEFDAALDAAEATLALDDRRQAMARLQRTLQDDAVMVQPVWAPALTLVRSAVRNLAAHPARYHHFGGVWLADGA